MRAIAFALFLSTACAASVDTTPDDGGGGGGAGASRADGVGAGVLGEDGLVTTCEEACDPIPASAPAWCRELCDDACERNDITVPPDALCWLERVEVATCVATELYHQGCPEDYGGCTDAANALNDCLVALEQGGGGTGP
jgi:hypothetical protein